MYGKYKLLISKNVSQKTLSFKKKFNCCVRHSNAQILYFLLLCPEFFYKALHDMLKLNDVPTMAKFCFALEGTFI